MTKVLAADIGFTATGMAIFTYDKEYCPEWRLFDTRCLHTGQEHTKHKVRDGRKIKLRLASVAHDDIRRAELMAGGIFNYYLENKCEAMVCEIPNGGAQSAWAAKYMGAATTMIAVIRLVLRCPADWITPTQSRTAAGWRRETHPGEKTKEIKTFVMGAMAVKYPAIAGLEDEDKEHIADACATFEAARGRQLIKSMEGK